MTIEQVWPEWQVDRLIGKGSYGAVYRCMKAGDKGKEYTAVKVISVPQDDFEADSVGSEGMTGEQSREYYKDITDNFINEIKILEALKDEKHIVNIQDSKVVEKEDGIGWQIFIRMELLTDFNTYASDKTLTANDVRKLALDLCDALIVCGKKRIVHRDIKPENIFVDAEGNFKLGDFGVAKQLEKTYASMSTKGTYNYMAPEVVASKKYDSRADIYSLGMVMYKLLNNNRLPFLDPEKKLIRFSERQEAFERRIKGEKIPPIPGVDDDLNEIILKACEFRADDRYRNVEEFRDALAKEKPSSKFVRLIKKHKVVSAIAFLLVLSIISGSCGYAFAAFKAKRVSYPEKDFVVAIAEPVVSLNGIGIVSDADGLRMVYETEEREERLSDRKAESMAFNGRQVCFTCYAITKEYYELRLIDTKTKDEQLLLSSDLELEPVFFDEKGVFYFEKSGYHYSLCYYSNNQRKSEMIDWICDFDIQGWSVEQIVDHIVLIYSEETGLDEETEINNNIYVVDLNNIEEDPDPFITDGTFCCADNKYLYYLKRNGAYVSLLKRGLENALSQEIAKVSIQTYFSIWSDLGDVYDYSINYNENISNFFPISRVFINNERENSVCDTLLDIYTGKKYRFTVNKERVCIVPAGKDIFGYCACSKDEDFYITGYIQPVSESVIRPIGEPSRIFIFDEIIIDDSTCFLTFTENGLYISKYKNESEVEEIVVFKSAAFQRKAGICI